MPGDGKRRGGAWELTIPGRLPGLNEMTRANRSHWASGAKQKKGWTRSVAILAKAAQLPRMESPVRVHLDWIEPNGRRDLDNIQAGVKYVLDGLVMAGVLPDDSRKYVRGISHGFPDPDKADPRILVRILPLEAGRKDEA